MSCSPFAFTMCYSVRLNFVYRVSRAAVIGRGSINSQHSGNAGSAQNVLSGLTERTDLKSTAVQVLIVSSTLLRV